MTCTRNMRDGPAGFGPAVGCPTAVVFEGATSYNDLDDLPTLEGEPIKGEMSGRIAGTSGGSDGWAGESDIDGLFDGGSGETSGGAGEWATDEDIDGLFGGGSGTSGGEPSGDGPDGGWADESDIDDLFNF